jgi:hypothetical protein
LLISLDRDQNSSSREVQAIPVCQTYSPVNIFSH